VDSTRFIRIVLGFGSDVPEMSLSLGRCRVTVDVSDLRREDGSVGFGFQQTRK
jgi:hypothetical protein